MPRKPNPTPYRPGLRIGKLVLVEPVTTESTRSWVVQCDCGHRFERRARAFGRAEPMCRFCSQRLRIAARVADRAENKIERSPNPVCQVCFDLAHRLDAPCQQCGLEPAELEPIRPVECLRSSALRWDVCG